MVKLEQVPAAILAGGRALRLGALTVAQPKALLDVAGEPFIDRQLRLLRRRGLSRVLLLAGHLGDALEAHVGTGQRFGLEVSVLRDGPRLLGTGGALRQALGRLGSLFFVLYGDSYTDIDFGALLHALAQRRAAGAMSVLANAGRWDRSNTLFRAGRLLAYDKHQPTPEMQHIDYGVGLLRASAFADSPKDQPFDLADLYGRLASEGRLIGHEVQQRFYEIGSPQGLTETHAYFSGQESRMTFAETFLAEAAQVAAQLDRDAIERLANLLTDLRRRGGRLFILGVGGSAGNASHAVNDFRKLCGIEAYAPTDNVSELTARTNDEGWESVFAAWLRISRLRADDMLLVFSVGGGSLERNVSPNLVRALEYGREVGASIGGIVGRDGGYTARVADACVLVPSIEHSRITPHAEAFQAVIWHLLVSHPSLQANATKWETLR